MDKTRADVKQKRQVRKVWRASYADMAGTVSISANTMQFLSDDGQVLTLDLPSFSQHGACDAEVGLMTIQALYARDRVQRREPRCFS